MGKFTKQHLFVDRLKSGKLEYFEDLYNYYYYIAEKHYNKYEDEKKIKAKNLAEEILTNAIIEYVKIVVPGSIYKISGFIHNKFQGFDKKLEEIPSLFDLEMLAYKGNRQAKIDILNRYKYLVDRFVLRLLNKINDFYNECIKTVDDYAYLDDEFNYPNNIVSKDDVYQDYYLKIWISINNYYDQKLETNYLSQYLSYRLNSFTDSYFKIIKNKFLEKSEENSEDIDSYFSEVCIDLLENKDINDKIESFLPGNLQIAYHELRKGKTYQRVADELKISKTRVGQCISTAKEIVKRKGIKR